MNATAAATQRSVSSRPRSAVAAFGSPALHTPVSVMSFVDVRRRRSGSGAGGGMLAESRDTLLASKWWLAVFPGVAIMLTVLSFKILGDFLGDVLDPRLRERR